MTSVHDRAVHAGMSEMRRAVAEEA